jgi:hypothetical protein
MKISKVVILLGITVLSACGGSGGGDSDGIVFEGELTQGTAVDHSARNVKHGENEAIESVKICALGRCSTTDGAGLFGFAGPSDFKGGDVLFSVDGHGILAEEVVNIPSGAKNVNIHFETSEKTEVHLHHLIIDGVAVDLTATHEAGTDHEGHAHE